MNLLVKRIEALFTNRQININNYFNLGGCTDVETSDVTSAADALREVTAGEVSHYHTIFDIPGMQKIPKFHRNKEQHVNYLLYPLEDRVHQIYNSKRAGLKL